MAAPKDNGGFLQVPTPGGLAPLQKQTLNPVPTGSATGNPRNKVALRPGYSLMDWIKLTKSGKDLAGTGGKLLQVSPAELARHKYRKDAWMAINGIVYNVTEYMDYHPGGWDELIRGAGKDATKMFNEIHQWVNYESMLSACMVGKLVQEFKLPPAKPSVKKSLSKSEVIPSIVGTPGPEKPKFDWHQTDTNVTISIYTRRKKMIHKEHVLVDYITEKNYLLILVRLPDDNTTYNLAYKLEKSIEVNFSVKVSYNAGKIEVLLKKSSVNERWNTIGTPLKGHESWVQQGGLPMVEDFPTFRPWKLVGKTSVTHDVDHYVFQPIKTGLHLHVPCGHHVQLKMNIEDIEIDRSYTPVFVDLDLQAYKNDDKRYDTNLHFLIKTYPKGVLTPNLKNLPLGAEIQISNPSGKFNAEILTNVTNVILLAAGTGITPMLKLIQYVQVLNGQDNIKRHITLVDFNKTHQDIIWFDQLEQYDEMLQVHHVLSQDMDHPDHHKGRVNQALLEELLPAKHDKSKVFICGPIPFYKECEKCLEPLSFSKNEIIRFEG